MNRVKQASDALAALIETAFAGTAGAKVFRNPKGRKAWQPTGLAVVLTDDDAPEVLRVMTGPAYDLRLEPELLLAQRGDHADRVASQWDAVETLKAALAADFTLGGAVEDARLDGSECADLDDDTWIGGGLSLRIRLLFNAPTPVG